VDDVRREAFLEFVCEMGRNWLLEDDMWEDAVRSCCCDMFVRLVLWEYDREKGIDIPTGLYFAWSFPTLLTACSSMSMAWPGRSFASTMFGLVGAGGLAANTSFCSPAGFHVKCDESSSWSMYNSFGSILSFGAFLLRSHCNLRVKTTVLRSVDWFKPKIPETSADADRQKK
jgi:hypothetical protein